MSTNTLNSTQRDARMEAAVRDALDRYAPLRMWRHSFQVQASDGKVVLSGSVRSQPEKEMAETLARQVRGVASVENQLMVDSDLELAVAQALGTDARTLAGFPGILVGVVFGVVYLKGTVPSEELKKAAGEIASRVAGVQRISNELRVPANAPAAS